MVVCCVALPLLILYLDLPLLEFCYCLRHNDMVNVKYNTFATAILWENINNDTLTLRVKCYNGISVRLRILSIIV